MELQPSWLPQTLGATRFRRSAPCTLRTRDRGGPGGTALQTSALSTAPVDWREERLRYQVLRFIYDRVGADCVTVLTCPEIQGALALTADDVLRVVGWLEAHEYVHSSGSRPSVCLTQHAIDYLEDGARRRHSLRT